jgi:integrase
MAKKSVFTIRIKGELIQKRLSQAEGRRWLLEMHEKKERIEAGFEDTIVKGNYLFVDVATEWYTGRSSGSKPKASHQPEWSRLENYIFPRIGARRHEEIIGQTGSSEFVVKISWTGGKKIQGIKREDWERIFREITDPEKDPKARNIGKVSPATCNRIRAMVSKIYNDTRKKIPHLINPIQDIEPLDEGDVEAKSNPPSPDALAKYLAVARKVSLQSFHKNLSFFVLKMIEANLGPRNGEGLGFKWKDLDEENGLLRLSKILERTSLTIKERTKGKRGKSKGRRMLGVNAYLMAALMEHKSSTPHNRPEDPIVHRSDGRPFSPRTSYDLHCETIEIAKIPYFRQHDIRHAHASFFRAAGGSRSDLQDRLGHSNPKTTERYEHFAPEYHKKQSEFVQIKPSNHVDTSPSVMGRDGEIDDKIDDNKTKKANGRG